MKVKCSFLQSRRIVLLFATKYEKPCQTEISCNFGVNRVTVSDTKGTFCQSLTSPVDADIEVCLTTHTYSTL